MIETGKAYLGFRHDEGRAFIVREQRSKETQKIKVT